MKDALLVLPPDYDPANGREFMDPTMREYFRRRLLAWKAGNSHFHAHRRTVGPIEIIE